MLSRIFSSDNWFFSLMSRVADLMLLNLLFLITCIPIVTIGSAISAQYYVTWRLKEYGETSIVKDYFTSFKSNLKQGIAIWLIFLSTVTFLVFDIYISIRMGGTAGNILKIIFISLIILVLMIFSYSFFILAKFINTVKKTIAYSAYTAIRHLPSSIIILLIHLVPIACFLLGSYFLVYGMFVYTLIGFSLSARINTIFFYKIFSKYTVSTDNVEEI